MLQLILHLSKVFFREPCSVQREILNRLQKKRGAWDAAMMNCWRSVCNTITRKNGCRNNYTKEFLTLGKPKVR